MSQGVTEEYSPTQLVWVEGREGPIAFFDLVDTGPPNTLPGADGRLATLLQLPLPEINITEEQDELNRAVSMVPTTLEESRVQELLEGSVFSDDHTRAIALIAYAFNACSVLGHHVPPRLQGHIADDIPDWYIAHFPEIDEILDNKPGRKPLPQTVADIIAATREYEDWPFLRNAININQYTASTRIGQTVELATRMLHIQAQKDYEHWLAMRNAGYTV